MNYSTAALNELAWAIDADGIGVHEAAAAAVVEQARALGLGNPSVDVLADHQVPVPVRERAFGKVVNAIVHAEAAAPEWAMAN